MPTACSKTRPRGRWLHLPCVRRRVTGLRSHRREGAPGSSPGTRSEPAHPGPASERQDHAPNAHGVSKTAARGQVHYRGHSYSRPGTSRAGGVWRRRGRAGRGRAGEGLLRSRLRPSHDEITSGPSAVYFFNLGIQTNDLPPRHIYHTTFTAVKNATTAFKAALSQIKEARGKKNWQPESAICLLDPRP